MKILLYIIVICIGAYCGRKMRTFTKLMNQLGRIQYQCLLLLLFIMGIHIGANNEVIENFYRLGYQAFVLSVCSILFSILGVKFISKYLNNTEEKKGYEYDD